MCISNIYYTFRYVGIFDLAFQQFPKVTMARVTAPTIRAMSLKLSYILCALCFYYELMSQSSKSRVGVIHTFSVLD